MYLYDYLEDVVMAWLAQKRNITQTKDIVKVRKESLELWMEEMKEQRQSKQISTIYDKIGYRMIFDGIKLIYNYLMKELQNDCECH